jgi:hypothetical protein
MATGTQWLPTIAADGAGGVLVSWQDHRSGEWDIYAQRVSGAGITAWPTNGVRVCVSGGDQTRPAVASDMAGGGLVAWEDVRCGASQIFGSHALGDGTLPSGSGVEAVALVPQSTQADSGNIRISWAIAHGTLSELPAVYCRHVDGGWRKVGTAWPDLQGNLAYSDFGALEGCQYGYALGVTNCGIEEIVGEVWVQTPVGHGFTALAVRSQQALADSGAVHLSWELAGGEALAATVFRRDSCSDWASLGTFPTDEAGRLAIVDRQPMYAGHRFYYRVVARACGADHDLGEFPVLIPQQAGFVPTAVSLVFQRVDTTSAALTWAETSGPPSVANVYRRDSLESWSLRASVHPDAGGRFHFLEGGLLPLHAYEYRIGLVSCGVEVVSAPIGIRTEPSADHGLWLRAAIPNPASHALEVDLSLSGADPATLELLDSAGRKLLQRRLDDLGPGLHAYTIQDLSRIPSGSYWLRLTQSGRSQTRRVAVIH